MPDTPESLKMATANAARLVRMIDQLDSGHWSSHGAGPRQRDYHGFWDQAQEILLLFRSVEPPLPPADRQPLWERFETICQDVGRQQRDEDETRELKSARLMKWILDETEKARPPTGEAPEERRFEAEAMDQALRHAAFLLSQHKEKMQGAHRLVCLKRLAAVEKVFEEHRRRQYRVARLKIKENLARNRVRWQQAGEGLDRLRNTAAELTRQIGEAGSPVFRQRLEKKLEETEKKIGNAEYSVREIESWIRADEEKLL